MQAVLYIGHGSRMKEGVDEAIQFIEKSKKAINVSIQEICFLELAKPSILEGIAKCVERGATKIAVMPILLLTAVHANEDIPLELEKAKRKYPSIQFTYGKTFGIHPKMIESLYDRITEKGMENADDAVILLVGRGSSDPAVKRDLTEIGDLLQDKYHFRQVDICFLYGAEPSFNDSLPLLKQTNHKQIFIIPYLLFTGLLMNGIEKNTTTKW